MRGLWLVALTLGTSPRGGLSPCGVRVDMPGTLACTVILNCPLGKHELLRTGFKSRSISWSWVPDKLG